VTAGRRALAGLLLAAALVAPALAPAQAACRDDSVALRGEWGQARFTVEVADDPAERGQGLMHRESMAPGAGMLFIYERPQPARFWMRNTLIPLDMIFADETGVVTHVHENAVPLDETVIDGGDNVSHVLEINGGLAGRLGIAPGTQMQHPSFEAPAWPCE